VGSINKLLYNVVAAPPYLSKHHAMTTYWGVEIYLHVFLTPALDGSRQLQAPAALPPVPIR